MRASSAFLSFFIAAVLVGCYDMRSSSGGGQTEFAPPRAYDAGDVALPNGYRIELVASGLTYPTGVAFDEEGRPHVIEAGYSYGEDWTEPRLLRIEPSGGHRIVAKGGKNGPWTGTAYANGHFYIAEGGQLEGGRILRVSPEGEMHALVGGLPGHGDHHTNGPAIGPDGYLYFGQGTATNSGVVGEDNAKFGWLKRFPQFHDIPCRDIRLSGQQFETSNVLNESGRAVTGAYQPFGVAKGETIVPGRLPCGGAIMRIPLGGGPLELVAWGFRNPFGLAFSPRGRLYVADNGYDDRGSRPVWGTGDHLWAVTPGTWYGWPDYSGGHPLTDPRFKPTGKAQPTFLLAQHPNKPPSPAAVLGVHSSSNGFDFSRDPAFGHVGRAFVAQFGDQAPTTGKVMAPVGFKVVRVDVERGVIEDFVTNKGNENGPASKLGTKGLERPVAARFNPNGQALYIVDFGVMLETPQGSMPQRGTGALWRVTRSGLP